MNLSESSIALVNLLPQPTSLEEGNKESQVLPGVCQVLSCPSARVRKAIEVLPLGGCSFECEIESPLGESAPNLASNFDYSLVIKNNSIVLSAREEWGALTGISTLQQLLLTSPQGTLRECEIKDSPTFPWRGLMIDVARHFIELSVLRETLDLMYYFKLNVLHLHLTDDQAFRFGCSRHPELVSNLHYTKAELRELVEHAADRAIRIVPEIDMPGHTSSWFLENPEWVLGPFEATECEQFGPHKACLDPSNSELMNVVFDVLAEVIDTFCDEFVHLGGDEVDFTWWNESKRVQEWTRDLGISEPQEFLTAFLQPVFEWLERNGRTPIVWDDSLHESLPSNVVVQAWRGRAARDQSIGLGYRTLVSVPYYLDLNYPAEVHFRYRPDMASKEWDDMDTLKLQEPSLHYVKENIEQFEDSVTYQPLRNRKRGEILGGEACMWSELVNSELIHKRIWTRMPVIAEQFWSAKEVSAGEIANVYERLTVHLEILNHSKIANLHTMQDVHPCHELEPLFEMLEPVKWYTRHLTLEGIRSRNLNEPTSTVPRPYNVHTQLNRVVDRLPVESLAARQCLKDLRDQRDLSNWISGWRKQHEVFEQMVEQYPDLEELREISNALTVLADVAENRAEFSDRLTQPYGEYTLPIAHAFRTRT